MPPPANLPTLIALGQEALAQNRFIEAENLFRQALRDSPGNTEALRGLGYALFQLNRLAEALPLLHDVVQRSPGDLLGRLLFGRLCLRLHEPELAEKQFQRILKKQPTSEAALSGLVDVAIARNQSETARRFAQRIVAINPKSEVGLLASAHAAESAQAFDEAHEFLDRLVRLSPQDVRHRFHRSRSLLRRGEFDEGWRDYELRFAAGKAFLPAISTPRWTGEPTDHLLLVVEQGLGDTLQFSRFIRQAKPLVRRITLACQPSLASLLTRSFAIDTIDVATTDWPDHDAHLPLQSLPHVLGLGAATLAPTGRYLLPEADRQKRWSDRLGSGSSRLRVGVVYASSVAHFTEQFPQTRRSCALADLDPLADIPDVEFFGLQLGVTSDEAALSRRWHDLSGEIRDFDDTAAVIDALDIVVSVDTSVVHLAGALEKPVALLLPYAADWRWMREEETTGWYASVRLFRQQIAGDWTAPVQGIRRLLESMVAVGQSPARSLFTSDNTVSQSPESFWR